MGKKKKIGLALGCGGARGIVHIGILRVLLENGIRPDFLAGSSMGAVIAAYYAVFGEIESLEKEVLSLRKRDIMSLVDLAVNRRSFLKGKKIAAYIEKVFGKKLIEDTKIPLAITASNLSTGREKYFTQGPIGEALLASIAVPGVFPPHEIDGQLYIDGGIVDPTPINKAKEMGADAVIGVDLVMKKKVEIKNPTLIQTVMQSYEIIRSQSIEHRILKHIGPVLVIQPEVGGPINSFKFLDIPKFIRIGEEAARSKLSEIIRIVN